MICIFYVSNYFSFYFEVSKTFKSLLGKVFAVPIDTSGRQAAYLCSSLSVFTLLMSARCSNTLTPQSITYCNRRIAANFMYSILKHRFFRLLIAYTQYKFDVHGSVHRKRILKYNQQDATLHNLFVSVKCSTCFKRYLRPSSGAQTVYTASGTLSNCNDLVKYNYNSAALFLKVLLFIVLFWSRILKYSFQCLHSLL